MNRRYTTETERDVKVEHKPLIWRVGISVIPAVVFFSIVFIFNSNYNMSAVIEGDQAGIQKNRSDFIPQPESSQQFPMPTVQPEIQNPVVLGVIDESTGLINPKVESWSSNSRIYIESNEVKPLLPGNGQGQSSDTEITKLTQPELQEAFVNVFLAGNRDSMLEIGNQLDDRSRLEMTEYILQAANFGLNPEDLEWIRSSWWALANALGNIESAEKLRADYSTWSSDVINQRYQEELNRQNQALQATQSAIDNQVVQQQAVATQFQLDQEQARDTAHQQARQYAQETITAYDIAVATQQAAPVVNVEPTSVVHPLHIVPDPIEIQMAQAVATARAFMLQDEAASQAYVNPTAVAITQPQTGGSQQVPETIVQNLVVSEGTYFSESGEMVQEYVPTFPKLPWLTINASAAPSRMLVTARQIWGYMTGNTVNTVPKWYIVDKYVLSAEVSSLGSIPVTFIVLSDSPYVSTPSQLGYPPSWINEQYQKSSIWAPSGPSWSGTDSNGNYWWTLAVLGKIGGQIEIGQEINTFNVYDAMLEFIK